MQRLAAAWFVVIYLFGNAAISQVPPLPDRGALPPAIPTPATNPAIAPLAERPNDSNSADGPVTSEVFLVRILGDAVNVRTRADVNSLIMTRVDRDSTHRALRQVEDWYQIEPPPGSFCYVAAEYIERLSDTEGIVKVDTELRVRGGSTVMSIDPLLSERLALLPDAARVTILGQDGQWYRIAPPEGVYGYVSTRYAEPTDSSRSAPRPTEPDQPPSTPTSQPAIDVLSPSAASPPAVLTPRTAEETELRILQDEMLIETRKPVLERDWAGILARLRPIADQTDDRVTAEIARRFIAQVEKHLSDQQFIREVEAVRISEERTRENYQREIEQIRRAQPANGPVYSATGMLAAIADSRPPRYVLIDPISRRVVGHLDMRGADPAPLVGRMVGIRGVSRFDPNLGATHITVMDIEILRRETNAP